VRGYSTEDVARALVNDGVYASNGDFYAATVAEVLQRGEDGFVRAGCACYTTKEEIDRLVTAVGRLAKA
jgi:selenocysteine lyase/cysteine desulfurase